MIKVIITQTPHSHSLRTTFVEVNDVDVTLKDRLVEAKQQEGRGCVCDNVKNEEVENYELKTKVDDNTNGLNNAPAADDDIEPKDQAAVPEQSEGAAIEDQQLARIDTRIEDILQIHIPKRSRTQRNMRRSSPLPHLQSPKSPLSKEETSGQNKFNPESKSESERKKRSHQRSILRRPDMLSIDEVTLSLPLMSHPKKQKTSNGKDGVAQTQSQKQKPKQKRKHPQSALEKMDCLFGCPKCEFSPAGCDQCKDVPVYSRPKTRWVPEQGRPQSNIPMAPTFRPTVEEFSDPIEYVSKITAQAAEYGVAHIIPPPGWDPPFALDKGTNGVDAESFRFKIRRQLTSHLCYRRAQPGSQPSKSYRQTPNTTASNLSFYSTTPEFGFTTLEREHTLKSFSAYADWVKSVHFSRGSGLQGSEAAPAPSVEEIEAEFWRIVESKESHHEALYGQDLDSGHHGSGFPLPDWRRQLLEEFLKTQLPPPTTQDEEKYASHPWNVNNMPRCESSMLRYLDAGDGLITGVMVPWLYVGSCMSAFCWHVEDHALYSVNYLHVGSPKVWYAVPAKATTALEEAMKDALPHLFEASPNLMHQLVTMLSPNELLKRGVPVYKVLHEAGSFVVTMPNAYHSGFNTGFNVAEAVNFAAPEWLPYGTDVIERYRSLQKPVTMSYDSLLVSLVRMAEEPQQQHNDDDEVKIEARRRALRDRAMAFAAGELALRAKEEKERWAKGLAALGCVDDPSLRIDKTSSMDVQDCAECKCDLWLASVVSPSVPGIAVCPEHAATLVKGLDKGLGDGSQELDKASAGIKILCRYTPEELQAMVDLAVKREEENGGRDVRDAIKAALERRTMYEMHRTKAVSIGPLYSVNDAQREPDCVGNGKTDGTECVKVEVKDGGNAEMSVRTPPEKKRWRGRPKKRVHT